MITSELVNKLSVKTVSLNQKPKMTIVNQHYSVKLVGSVSPTF
ncbi:hypothetical protein IMCC21906_01942 [Spongiibacter sp. IMCC21906]|nr:hypothetical protein IMCC21906_01942 [Spongiibacter sp. IMCC21906]